MNLGEELRSTLGQEADMRAAPPPDIEGLVRGGRLRRRRRNTARVGLAAVVLLGGTAAAYGVAQTARSGLSIDSEIAPQPSEPSGSATPPPLPDEGNPDLRPGGTYRVFVGTGADGTRILADVTLEGRGWSGGDFATVSDQHDTHAGFGVYQPRGLADGSGCVDDASSPDVGDTAQGLAGQLARLPRSTIVKSPTSTQAFGYDAVHLRMRIANGCPGNYYRVADSLSGSRGITYTEAPAMVVIDFWVLDLDGVPVVVDAWYPVGASAALVAKATQARDSITFVADGA